MRGMSVYPLVCALAISILVGASVRAADGDHQRGPLTIDNVFVDTMNNSITVLIDNVRPNSTLRQMTLGAPGFIGDITGMCSLNAVAVPPMVVCSLANLPPAGDYRLVVTTTSVRHRGRQDGDDRDDDQTARYDLTLGAVGPQGSKGDTGATGAQGVQGVPGSQGPSGPQGLPGAPGAVGPRGPAGIVPGATSVGPTIYQVPRNNGCGGVAGSLTMATACNYSAPSSSTQTIAADSAGNPPSPLPLVSLPASTCLPGETSTFISSTPSVGACTAWGQFLHCYPGYDMWGNYNACHEVSWYTQCTQYPLTVTATYSCASSFQAIGKLVQ